MGGEEPSMPLPILLMKLLSAGIKCGVNYSIYGVKMSRMTGGPFFSQEIIRSSHGK